MRILICIIFFLVLHSCGEKPESLTVELKSITESVYASGVVKARNQYEVFSTVNGIVDKILVTEGQTVTKGQAIIQLVNDASRLTAENAALAAKYSSLQANTDKLNEARINIDLARAKMQNDSALLERQRNLWAQEIGTRNELDQRELALRNSSTAYRSAQLRYNDLKKQLEFTSRQSGKSLAISSSFLNDFTLRSKLNGRIYSVLKEPGELVTAQMPVAIIGDASSFFIELQVDEFDISRIRIGQKVMVSMDSYKGQTFEAVIEKIDPIMNERSRTFMVEAGFVKAPGNLYPNLTAETNILVQVKSNTITIPKNYLAGDSLVILENKEKRRVITGVQDYHMVEITSGLKKGEVIIKPEQ